MKNRITTVIVDDEPLARKRIVKLLNEDEEILVSAVCGNGKEAITEINTRQPDVVFLDIQMPEVDGFEVLQQIETDYLPAIVFVTAYDEYAIRAFEVHALDYLLKPFDKSRFFEALKRAKKAARASSDMVINEKLNDLLHSLNSSDESLRRLLVKSSGRFFFLKTEEIDWIEAAGNYVKIHVGDKNYMIRDTMINMENKLASDLFFRIHRSAIVNVEKIRELKKWFHGDYKVVLENGEELTMSRNYKELLQRFS